MDKNKTENKKPTADSNPKENKKVLDDASEIIIEFMMPFVAKIILNLIPKDQWQTIVSDKKKLWETATIAAPFIVRRLTKLKPFYDDLVTNLFQEINQEIRYRESGESVKKSEQQIKASLLDLLSNEANKDEILEAYADVMGLAITKTQKHHLNCFIAGLKPESFLVLLKMSKAPRDKFVMLTIGQPGKEESGFMSFFQEIEKILANVNEGIKIAWSKALELDSKFAPGTELDIRINTIIEIIKYEPCRKRSIFGKIGYFVTHNILKIF